MYFSRVNLRRPAPGIAFAISALALTSFATPVQAVNVSCGQIIRTSITVTNDLIDCPTDGLRVGASNITINLNGHTIDGAGFALSTGIRTSGHDGVTIQGSPSTSPANLRASIKEFEVGVSLSAGSNTNVVEKLNINTNGLIGLEISGARANTIRSNIVDRQLKDGVHVLLGSVGNIFTGNRITNNGENGVFLDNSSNNRFQGNRILGNLKDAMFLQLASNNLISGNNFERNKGGITVVGGEPGDPGNATKNKIQKNTFTLNESGILVSGATSTSVTGNTITDSLATAITVEGAGSIISANQLQFNSGGIALDLAPQSTVRSNTVSENTGAGITIGLNSQGTQVLTNRVLANGGEGVVVEGGAPSPGVLLDGNTADFNMGDGISLAARTHTVRNNRARSNLGFGIFSVVGNIDGGGNIASGNGEAGETGQQCANINCN